MIEPTKITNFNRSDAELQTFWIFCICVAGKNADQTAKRVTALLRNAHTINQEPFSYFRQNPEELRNSLLVARVGQYTRMARAIQESLDLDLRNCTLQDLLKIYGVGPKTARFFLLHSRGGDNNCNTNN